MLTVHEALVWIDKWRIKKYSKANYPLRMGQEFCNEFNIHDSALFNERDERRAADMIFENYTLSE